MKLSEFFNKANTKNIVINTDIDGFLSGMLLQKYYGCKVVGFSNSRESIWLTPEIESIFDPVYIDIFINNQDTFCIDQHIVAYDDAHLNRLLKYGTKLNPNLNVQKRTYETGFRKKYPFGTVHYLIALIEEEGNKICFNDLSKEYVVKGYDEVQYKVCPGQIILRADDALYSSLGPYSINAKEWWEQLCSYNSPTIALLYEYLKKCNEDDNEKYKIEIGDFFRKGLWCDGSDGAFKNIIYKGNGMLQRRVLRYCEEIGTIVGMQLDLPTRLNVYQGKPNWAEYSEELLDKATTYAFIHGKEKGKGFSYTTDIR